MSALRDQLTYGVYAAGWGAVKMLPEPVAVRLGRTIADLVWKRRGKGVLRLESNYARVLPDATPEQLRELSRAGMRSYLRYWMESFRLPVWSEERIRSGFEPEGQHHLTEALAAGKGVVAALPHLGNWDLAGAWATTALDIPFTTVAERLKPEKLFDRFVAYREGLGMEVLPHTGGAAFGRLARRLRDGGLVCLVAERDLSASGVEVDFFGDTTRMPAGPALLAQHTGARLLPVTLWFDASSPVMRGRIHPPVDVPESGTRAEKTSVMTQALADVFAAGIAEHPEDWHMLQRLWLADLEPGPGPGTETSRPAPAAAPAAGARGTGAGTGTAERLARTPDGEPPSGPRDEPVRPGERAGPVRPGEGDAAVGPGERVEAVGPAEHEEPVRSAEPDEPVGPGERGAAVRPGERS